MRRSGAGGSQLRSASGRLPAEDRRIGLAKHDRVAAQPARRPEAPPQRREIEERLPRRASAAIGSRRGLSEAAGREAAPAASSAASRSPGWPRGAAPPGRRREDWAPQVGASGGAAVPAPGPRLTRPG